MYYVTTSPLGIFALDDKNRLVSSIFFSQDPKRAKDQYNASQNPALSPEEKELLKSLNGKDILFETKKDSYTHVFPNPAGEYVRSNLAALAAKNSLSQDRLRRFLYAFNFELTKESMQSESTGDRLIIQAVSAMDDLDRTINLMCMRLREWYSLYFPEASEKLKDNERFAGYVSDTLYRNGIDSIDIAETIGTDVGSPDLEEQRSFAKTIQSMLKERKNLEVYIEKKCKEVIPNMTAIVGAEHASRILAHAGSTVKLAKFPSSTIQILGAEKALFRYLHNVGTSPKHGIIFNTGYIQRTPKEHRGKIARILASKLSLASKVDHYKGEFCGDKLKAGMEKALDDILRQTRKKENHAPHASRGKGMQPAHKKDPFRKFRKNKKRRK